MAGGHLAQALGMANRPSLVQALFLAAGGAVSALAYVYMFTLWGIVDRPLVSLGAGSEGGFFIASLFSLCLFSLLAAAVFASVLRLLCGSYLNAAATIFGAVFIASWLGAAIAVSVPPSVASLVSFVAFFGCCMLWRSDTAMSNYSLKRTAAMPPRCRLELVAAAAA